MRLSVAIYPAFLFGIALTPAAADEGMWTYNNFPADKVEKAYGFTPDQSWLDHVRLSSVRLARGCSGSFVSPNGLVLTNHHCARDCIEQLSTPTNDLVAKGFYAKRGQGRGQVPGHRGQPARRHQRRHRPRSSRRPPARTARPSPTRRRRSEAAIAAECSRQRRQLRCDVVELYHGGVYNLYKYRRYQDVRLVFAPEVAIAFFGGDPDNFNFPRYDLDVSFLRVYRDGKPLDTQRELPALCRGRREGGRPDLRLGPSRRDRPPRHGRAARIPARRRAAASDLPAFGAARRPHRVRHQGRRSRRASPRDLLFGIENSLKASKGQFEALVDPTIIKNRRDRRAGAARQGRRRSGAEGRVRRGLGRDPRDARPHRAQARPLSTSPRAARASARSLFGMRQGAGARRRRGRRSRTTSACGIHRPPLPDHAAAILSTAPIYPELEKLTLTFSLTKLREVLGPDDPFVKKVLGKKSPAAAGRRAGRRDQARGSRAAQAAARRRPGGDRRVEDPMIEFVRAIDPDARRAQGVRGQRSRRR